METLNIHNIAQNVFAKKYLALIISNKNYLSHFKNVLKKSLTQTQTFRVYLKGSYCSAIIREKNLINIENVHENSFLIQIDIKSNCIFRSQ